MFACDKRTHFIKQKFFKLPKFLIFIPPIKSLPESLVLYITINKYRTNFPQNFRDFYTYLHKLLSRDCQILLFKNVYSAKGFSKTTGNFLNSKLLIFGMHFAKSTVFHHIYTISLFTTYQLQSSRKKTKLGFSKEFISQDYLFL